MKLNEVDKLIELQHLTKLTLHGNPIENDKSYRLYVLTRIPRLRNFDMTGITRGDRLTADIWQRNMPIKKKKSRHSTDM
ncbi:Leucine-rich repeat-containing protein 51 [Lamellibrachia satsuma]|nr:Leucine-rich repeat-containing protein 51 [Lamellibrachia satsuma]